MSACVIVTVTLAMLAALELAARALSHVRGEYLASRPSTIAKQPWGSSYVSDERGLSYRHVNYVEFREKPYRSSMITVDDAGLRPVPGNCTGPDALVVWTFGGSTMFGYGVPDAFTIPAYLAEILNRGGRCVKVVNFGAGSWQSSQSLIQLIENLKRGLRPYAVIFYDGINDSSVVAEGEAPGGIDSEVRLRLDQSFEPAGMFQGLARGSALVRMVSNRIFRAGDRRAERAHSALMAELPGRAKALASIYAENLRLIDVLAKEFGFNAYYFLQPFPVISGKTLTHTEKEIFKAWTDSPEDGLNQHREFYRAIRLQESLRRNPRYFDISDIFDARDDEIYVDSDHLLPLGNRIVAERIAREVYIAPALH